MMRSISKEKIIPGQSVQEEKKKEISTEGDTPKGLLSSRVLNTPIENAGVEKATDSQIVTPSATEQKPESSVTSEAIGQKSASKIIVTSSTTEQKPDSTLLTANQIEAALKEMKENKITDEEIANSRIVAIQALTTKTQGESFNEDELTVLNKEFEFFKELDRVALNLLKEALNYKGNTTQRQKSFKEIRDKVNESYTDYPTEVVNEYGKSDRFEKNVYTALLACSQRCAEEMKADYKKNSYFGTDTWSGRFFNLLGSTGSSGSARKVYAAIEPVAPVTATIEPVAPSTSPTNRR